MELKEQIKNLRSSIASDQEILPYQDGQGYYKMRADIQAKQQKLRELEKELDDASPDAPKG